MPDRAGQQLGNYRLLRQLGRGGFAEVYLGEHVYLKRRAALKVLHISLEDEDVEHFLAEAQVLARLDHPHIVRVHEFAVEQGTPFLVMEYASRGTLRQRHPRGSCLSLQTTVAYVKQIAAALQYAHNHQVIHRDVKPENVLLGSQQELLLSDFGISLLSPSPEQLSTQEMAGTLPYMAPEQIRGKPGFASDQYSLAVIVYEWLCGGRPFEGATWQIAYQQVSLAPAPLREHDPSLPEAVEEVVLKALAKDPRDRYVSVQLFAQALERASQGSRLDLDADTEVTAPLDAISPAASSTPPAISKRIFLSAVPEDEAFAARLTSDLQQRGIAVWNEDPEITQNVLEQENVVRQAIRAVDVVLLVVSPGTPSSRSVREHLRITSLYQRQLVFVWAAGEDIAAVLPAEWGRAAQVDLLDARNGRYEQALGEIVACLEEIPAEERSLAEPAEELREPRNPYKGLRPFTQHDAADFFGRDSLIAELVGRLREAGQPGTPQARLLAVIGPSGSGKSSVVMAGLLPRLQQGALPGSEHWVYLEPMVPGAHPLEALVLTLAKLFPDRSLKAMREDLQDESARSLHLLAAQLVKAPGQKVVLLIDQFEELFKQTTAEEERQHLIDLLVTAMTEPQGAAIVILTLRADLYDRPMSYPELGRLIVQRQVLVWPMEVQDLRAVIKRPAALPDVQLSFEGNLVGDLLFEVQGQVGALPLLQFTLEQLFEQRNGHTLTLQTYQQIGGVKGALAKHAEATYAALPSEEHRRLARALFLRLIDPGLTEQDTTRRRAAITEVSLPDARQTALLKETADAFVKARLLTTNEVVGVTTIEVSHEALIREWARLAGWLRDAREDIVLQQGISADAAEWLRRQMPTDRLYRDTELAEAQAWMERNIPSKDEVEFLQSSLAEQRQRRAAEESRQARELSLQHRVVSRQRLLLAALSLFSIVVIILGTLAEVGRQQADAQRQMAQTQALIARSRTLAAQANAALLKNQIDRALLLSVKANQTYNAYDARDSLLTALEYSPRLFKMLRTNFLLEPSPGLVVATLAFGPSGHSLVSFAVGGEAWDTKTWRSHNFPLPCVGTSTVSPNCSPTENLTNALNSVTLSPDGQTVAVAGSQGLWIWNVETGTRVIPLEVIPTCPPSPSNQCAVTTFTAIAFSSDGKTLASSLCTQGDNGQCSQDRILLWDLSSTKPTSQLLTNQSGLAVELAFSPDGKFLAIDNADGTVSLWDIASKNLTSQIATGDVDSYQVGPVANQEQEEDLAFSPSGKVLATTSSRGAILLWDVTSGKLAGSPLASPGGAVQQLAFSPDGKTLAASSTDNSIRLWDLTTGALISQPLLGHTQPVVHLAFSPDGAMLASLDHSANILLWNMAADSLLSRRLKSTNTVSDLLSSVVFSPDGKVIIIGNEAGQVVLRDAQTGKLLDTLDATQNPLILSSYSEPFNDNNALTIASLTFSPDGSTLAAGRRDGLVFLWDWPTRKPLAHFRSGQALRTLVYSPDGRQIASTYDSGNILLMDAASGKIIYTLSTRYSPRGLTQMQMSTAAFSRDGTVLAVGENNTVVLWDVRNGRRLGQPLEGHATSVESVAFSPDGSILASRDSDDTIILWNAHTLKPIHQLFDVDQNADPGTYSPPASAGLVFNSNGSILASAAIQNGTFSVTLWDVASQEPVVHPFQEDQDSLSGHYALNSIVFSADGKQLAAIATSDPYLSHITFWNIDIGSWQSLACSVAGRNFTLAEWQQFANNEPYMKVCSGFPVDPSIVSYYLSQAHAAALIGNRQEASSDYAEATYWVIDSGDADFSNSVCREGSLDQFAKSVLPACDYAVTSNPSKVDYRDSRGVARALAGDTRGAIADFRFVVQPANGYGNLSPKQIQERRQWLQELEKGRNPFDAKTLAALQHE